MTVGMSFEHLLPFFSHIFAPLPLETKNGFIVKFPLLYAFLKDA